MKTAVKYRSLKLHKETLRLLGNQDLRIVGGGLDAEGIRVDMTADPVCDPTLSKGTGSICCA
jgi:hypothetical protein